MGRRSKVDYDSIKYREYLWDKEYASRKALPSTNSFHPSSSLRHFIEKYPNIKKDSALDIGCGNGRNSVYLAQNGFKHILGIDISSVGINIANEELKKTPEFADNIKYVAGDVGEVIEKESGEYDLILDMCVLHSLTKESREKVIANVKKLISPNGYFLLFTLMANSPAVLDLKEKYPGPEDNSYRFEFEEDTITERAFDKEELIEMYKPFKLVEYEEYQTVTRAFKGEYPRIYVTCLFQNIVE